MLQRKLLHFWVIFQCFTSNISHKGGARDFIKLKPTKHNEKLRDIWPSYMYFTFQIANYKGADQTARMPLLLASNKVRVSRIEAHVMLKPMLLVLRLPTHLPQRTKHMHAGAIRKLLYCCAYIREIIYSLKLVDYLPVQVHTHKPYNN